METINEEIISKLESEFLDNIKKAKSLEKLEELKNRYLSRKGEVRKLFKMLSELPLDKKKVLGEKLNYLNDKLENIFKEKYENISKKIKKDKKIANLLLASLPKNSIQKGSLHPLQQVMDEIIDIFTSLGFSVVHGPEIEFEDYNFTKLNIPKDHPARDMQDTLYIDIPETDNGKVLLRTHTSPVQVRVMLSQSPPIKVIVPGRVYRHENVDASHSFCFHQVEGLVVSKNVRLSDLMGVLNYFAEGIFGKKVRTRFRQSYFPFTEPSLEMDIECLICEGKGCSACKQKGYMELLGCGMVNPQVFNNVGYGYEEYTGFAFGMGVERIMMLKYKVNDIRLNFENDLRFLIQF